MKIVAKIMATAVDNMTMTVTMVILINSNEEAVAGEGRLIHVIPVVGDDNVESQAEKFGLHMHTRAYDRWQIIE